MKTADSEPLIGAALGGLDAVVFTAGDGENAAPVRAAIGRACGWLGLELDQRPTASIGNVSARQ